MSHSYVSNRMHCVFSTKERRKLIDQELEARLQPYIVGIARQNGFQVAAVGGMEDHIHLLVLLPGPLSVSTAIQLIKGGSSKWIHDEFPQRRSFAWQEGYGAFGVGISQMDQTVAYIKSQKRHHRRKTFEEEFISFLKKHKIEYDPKYVFG
jgi:REP-associated tyrosine transposase